jgi:hypothetical protein
MERECVIKDSGDRTQFASGAVRDLRIGKGMSCLIPVEAWIRLSKLYPNGYAGISIDAWTRLAIHYEKGRIKYSDANNVDCGNENWLKGIPLMIYFDSAVRHLQKFLQGEKDEDHLAATLWNICGMIETERRIDAGILPKELDNRDKNAFTNCMTTNTSLLNSTTIWQCWNLVMGCLICYKMNWTNADYLAIALREVTRIMEMERLQELSTDDRDTKQNTSPMEGD